MSETALVLDFEELEMVFILLKRHESDLTTAESRLLERIRAELYRRFSIEEMEAFEQRYGM